MVSVSRGVCQHNHLAHHLQDRLVGIAWHQLLSARRRMAATAPVGSARKKSERRPGPQLRSGWQLGVSQRVVVARPGKKTDRLRDRTPHVRALSSAPQRALSRLGAPLLLQGNRFGPACTPPQAYARAPQLPHVGASARTDRPALRLRLKGPARRHAVQPAPILQRCRSQYKTHHRLGLTHPPSTTAYTDLDRHSQSGLLLPWQKPILHCAVRLLPVSLWLNRHAAFLSESNDSQIPLKHHHAPKQTIMPQPQIHSAASHSLDLNFVSRNGRLHLPCGASCLGGASCRACGCHRCPGRLGAWRLDASRIVVASSGTRAARLPAQRVRP